MATLPTVPGPFTDGTTPTLTQMNQLSQAVSFISDNTTRPLWHVYQTNTFSLSASTWSSTGSGGNPYTVAYDNDGVNSGNKVTIVTRGYYSVEACIGIAVTGTAFTLLGSFLWTAGGSNPNFTSGTTLRFGGRGGDVISDGSSNSDLCLADICPNVCYPGDTIAAQCFPTTATTLKVNANGSWNQGRFVSNFTGMWIAEGT